MQITKQIIYELVHKLVKEELDDMYDWNCSDTPSDNNIRICSIGVIEGINRLADELCNVMCDKGEL